MLGNAFAVDGTARARSSKETHRNSKAKLWNDSQRRGFVEHGIGAAIISSALYGEGMARCGMSRWAMEVKDTAEMSNGAVGRSDVKQRKSGAM